jgi:kinesin family member 11
MQALDDFVTRARSQNERHHGTHLGSLNRLSSIVKQSYTNLNDHFTTGQDRVRCLENVISTETSALQASLPPLASTIQMPLSDLCQEIAEAPMKEYSPTGETPQKTQYVFPTTLPRTEPHERILAKLSRPTSSSSPSRIPASPNKSVIYNDIQPISLPPPLSTAPLVEDEVKTSGLREIDLNVRHSDPPTIFSSSISKPLGRENTPMGPPPLKRQATMESKLPQKLSGFAKAATVLKLEGRENAVSGVGRRLRSSPLG